MTPLGISPRRVIVAGQGYVGLPLAMRAVEVGFDVVGFDTDKNRIDCLLDGTSYIDDVTDGDLSAAARTGRYLPTDDSAALADFDVAVVCVPTPLRNGTPDLSYVEAAAGTIAPHITLGSCVILESTSYPGTTEEVFAPILEAGSGLSAGREFSVGYSPERIDPGNGIWRIPNTPNIISGVSECSLRAVHEFYGRLVERTVPVSGTREAELAKLLENTFRHVNIALINELAMYCHGVGIDVWSVIDAAATKPFGFMAFTPGPGVGGHCLPVDPSYLSSREMFGPDVAASITTSELRLMVEGVRYISTALAAPVDKDAVAAELAPVRALFGRSLVPRCALPAGHVLAVGDLVAKKPAGGIPPTRLESVVGRCLRRAIQADEPLHDGDLQ